MKTQAMLDLIRYIHTTQGDLEARLGKKSTYQEGDRYEVFVEERVFYLKVHLSEFESVAPLLNLASCVLVRYNVFNWDFQTEAFSPSVNAPKGFPSEFKLDFLSFWLKVSRFER